MEEADLFRSESSGSAHPSRRPSLLGVDQKSTAAFVRLGLPPLKTCVGDPLSPSVAFGVGHGEDENAFPFVACADFCRREQSSLNLEAQAMKVSPDTFRTARRQHPTDVLDEDEPCARLHDDAPCV
nr:hypothetical protein [Sinorhizobium meliloti]